MSTTTPIQNSFSNRISRHLEDIQPELDWRVTQRNTTGLPPIATCGWSTFLIDKADELTAGGYRLPEDCDRASLTIKAVPLLKILVERTISSHESHADTDRLIDRSDLDALSTEGYIDTEYEWDTYPEPLWDPLKSEVQLLVTEYFERADADTD